MPDNPYAAYGGTVASPTQASKDPYAAYGGGIAGTTVTNSAGETLPADVAARHAKNQAAAPQTEGWGNTYTDIGEGFAKGAGDTVQNVGKFLHNKLGVSMPEEITGTTDPTTGKHVELRDTTPQNTAQTVGMTAENVLEFMAGDEALKSVGAAEKLKRAAKLAEALEQHPVAAKAFQIGANALRTGTVGAVQATAHGATPTQAVETGAVAGATGGALETLAEGAGALKKVVTSGKNVAQKGAELTGDLAGGNLQSPTGVARTVGQHLDQAEDAMHSSFEQGMQEVSSKAKDVPIRIQGSPLQKAAQDLLTDSRVPGDISKALKGVVPDSEKLEPLLQKFADGAEESVGTTSKILDASGNPIRSQGSQQPLSYTWDEMEATRQKIGAAFRKLPLDSPLRPDLNKLRSAIDETLQQSAEQAEKPEIAQQMKSLRSGYAQTRKALDDGAITALREKNPDAVADVLMNKSSVHNVTNLRQLIGSENMKPVEASLFQRIVDRASVGGDLNGDALKKSFNSLGPDVQKAIWGSRLADVKEFVDAAAHAQKSGKLTELLSKGLNHGKYGLPIGAGTVAAYETVKGNYETAGKALGLAALGKVLTNPTALNAITKTLQGGSGVGAGLSASAMRQATQSLSEPNSNQ